MSTYDMMTPAVRVALRAYVVTLYIYVTLRAGSSAPIKPAKFFSHVATTTSGWRLWAR